MSAGEDTQSLRHIVAGMLSTIDYVPAQAHPEEMLNMADKVIHHVNLFGGAIPGDVRSVSQGPEGPFEGQDKRY